MSDQIYLSGDRITMTEEEYAGIWKRIGIGDYSDLPKLFVFAPPKPVQEMSVEEKVEHKKLLERAIQILRIQVSFMIDNLTTIAHDATEEERRAMFEYEKKYGPKAKEVIAQRAKRVTAREKMIEGIIAEKGWDRTRAAKYVDILCADDEADDAAVVADANVAVEQTGLDAVSETVTELKPGFKCQTSECGEVFEAGHFANVQIGSRIYLTATCRKCRTFYRKAIGA